MNVISKLAVLVIGAVPGACHYVFTGPLLWEAANAVAYEAWWALWMLAGSVLALAIGWAFGDEVDKLF